MDCRASPDEFLAKIQVLALTLRNLVGENTFLAKNFHI
jgi:hypothetical protein